MPQQPVARRKKNPVKKLLVLSELTPRRKMLAAFLAYGYSNAEIAELMSMPVTSVKYELRLLYTYLGARNRAHAVAQVYRMGVVKLPR